MWHIAIDAITFVLASLIFLTGTGWLNIIPDFVKPPKDNYRAFRAFVSLTAFIFIVAQSSWFSSWANDSIWGRDWANFLWFIFNTNTMIIFAWALINAKGK